MVCTWRSLSVRISVWLGALGGLWCRPPCRGCSLLVHVVPTRLRSSVWARVSPGSPPPCPCPPVSLGRPGLGGRASAGQRWRCFVNRASADASWEQGPSSMLPAQREEAGRCLRLAWCAGGHGGSEYWGVNCLRAKDSFLRKQSLGTRWSIEWKLAKSAQQGREHVAGGQAASGPGGLLASSCFSFSGWILPARCHLPTTPGQRLLVVSRDLVGEGPVSPGRPELGWLMVKATPVSCWRQPWAKLFCLTWFYFPLLGGSPWSSNLCPWVERF